MSYAADIPSMWKHFGVKSSYLIKSVLRSGYILPTNTSFTPNISFSSFEEDNARMQLYPFLHRRNLCQQKPSHPKSLQNKLRHFFQICPLYFNRLPTLYPYYDNFLFAETKQSQVIQRQAFAATILCPLHQVLEKMLN